MPYIPKHHEKYGLLPSCREHGGEVFDYPSELLSEVNKLLKPDDNLIPYGYNSYEEYFDEVDRLAEEFKDNPDKYNLFVEFKKVMREMNCKEEWSILRYIGEDDDNLFGVTKGKIYYWPASKSDPVYSGVIDDEEFTAYWYATDSDLWEILEDPTGMAYNTIYCDGENSISSEELQSILGRLKNAVVIYEEQQNEA